MKDQRLAIQWTHENIHLFGGNPEKITIFGQSAGSGSVAYQLLNQESSGLFLRVSTKLVIIIPNCRTFRRSDFRKWYLLVSLGFTEKC